MNNKFTEPTIELMKFMCAGETNDVNTGEGDPSVNAGNELDEILGAQ